MPQIKSQISILFEEEARAAGNRHPSFPHVLSILNSSREIFHKAFIRVGINYFQTLLCIIIKRILFQKFYNPSMLLFDPAITCPSDLSLASFFASLLLAIERAMYDVSKKTL